jgi:hypothetical protein
LLLQGWRIAGPQGYVDGPVGSAWLAELAGAVEGVDYPYPVGGQAGLVVDALFREDGVARPGPRQLSHQELVGLPVAGFPQDVRFSAPGAQFQEEAACALG